jgi:amino acid adenylation domain-containing protein
MSGNVPDHAAEAVDYDPFAEAAPLARVVPTTEAQREIWLACQLGGDATLAYNEAVTLMLHGAVDLAALRASVQELVDRHDALRATFGADGQEIYIAEAVRIDLPIHDLSGIAASEQAAALDRDVRVDVDLPFDLEKGPLLRARIVVLGPDQTALILTAHHIVCDGWSFGVLLRDLGDLYAHACGHPVAPEAASSFGDFSLALATRAQTAEHRADEAHWLGRYTSTPPVLDLPLDHPRPPQRGFASQRMDHVLSADLVDQVRRLGAKQGASLFSSLLAGFAALLQRLSGSDEGVVGVPAAGQTLPGFEHTVGHGVNLLPLRLSLSLDAPLTKSLSTVQAEVLDGFEHQHYTFGTLLKKLVLERDPSRVPLAPVMFNLDQPMRLDGFPGLRAEAATVPRHFENFELFINAVPLGDGALRLECQYAATLFDDATVRRWLAGYDALLRAATVQPEALLADIDIVTAEDLARLADWNATAVALPPELLIHRWLLSRPDIEPTMPALISGEHSLTHAELWQRAHRIAHALRERGLGRGSRVGLCLPRDADMLPALLGTLESGATYIPLDPSFPATRLADMAEDAGLALLITHSAVANALPWPRAQSLWIDVDAEMIARQPGTPPAPDPARDAEPESAAYIIYTSGSTGKPKGVMVPHRAIVNFLLAVGQRPGLTPGDRLLAVTTLSFDIAVLELLLPVATGGCVVLATRDDATDGAALIALLDRHDITTLQATPATWRLLFDAAWAGRPGFKALVGGEALPADLARQLTDRCGEVWNMYGPTETTVWSTCWRVETPLQTVAIGTPLANTQVRVLDPRGKQCPIGVPGEIHIGGAGVALGYWQRELLTAERFIIDPLGARLYKTGDRGRWRNDGQLEHLGRLDFQVKLRGFRIELGDVETHLTTHPDLSEAVAVVREDTPGDARLVAYVVPREGRTTPSIDGLREHLKASLPAYMIPQHFVALDALPRLPNGKIDRKRLPAPSPERAASEKNRVAARNALEQAVLETMEQVLKLPAMSVLDDFFAFGGHSLLAAQLIAQLNRKLDVNLPFRMVFESPTAASLALAIDRLRTAGGTGRIAIRHDPARKSAPLTAQQERIAFLEELHPGRVTYNAPSAHRLRGPMDRDAFLAAFRDVVARQPIMRTQIIRQGPGHHLQEILPEVDVSMPVEDLRHIPSQDREAELMRRMQAVVDIPFDIHAAPLWRARLYILDDAEHAFLFMPHHIIWDGWSFDILYDEMAAAYAARANGRPNPLPALPVTYADFAAWQAEWIESEPFSRKLLEWNARMTQTDTPKALGTDRPRSAGMSGSGATEWIRIDTATTERLREVARSADLTLNMLTLGLYGLLVADVAASPSTVIATPVRARTVSELENVMGFFNNLLPLQLTVRREQPVLDTMRVVKDELIDAMNLQDVPFERLAMEPQMRERSVKAGIYQALFSFQDARDRDRQWGPLSQSGILIFQNGATQDMGLWLMDVPHGLEGGVTYNADIYTEQTAKAFLARYLELVQRLLTDPKQTVGALLDPKGSTATAGLAHLAANAAAVAPRAAPPTEREARTLTPTEADLTAVWANLLNLPPEDVRLQDNFFDLGGDSLSAMQVITQMHDKTGKRIQIQSLIFESLQQIALQYDNATAMFEPTGAGATTAQANKPGLLRRLFGRS